MKHVLAWGTAGAHAEDMIELVDQSYVVSSGIRSAVGLQSRDCEARQMMEDELAKVDFYHRVCRGTSLLVCASV